MKRYSLMLLLVFAVCAGIFAQTAEDFLNSDKEKKVEIPLITAQVDSLVKEDFNTAMLNLAERSDKTVGVFDFGLGIGPGLLVNGSLLTFININNWFSLPLFVAGGGGMWNGGAAYRGGWERGSFSIGSGFIIKNRYFLLGLMAGFYSETEFDRLEAKEKTNKFDFGIYPVFNTSQYPWLSFLEIIYGYLANTEPKVSDIKIDSFNYLLNLTFKPILALSVLELYTRKGINNFIPAYDLSKTPIFGGDNIYKTNTYGLKIGIDPFWVDLNYQIVDGKLLTYTYIDERSDYEYVDYEYPFNLNGFLSATFNFSIKFLSGKDSKIGWFLRFSTFNVFDATGDVPSNKVYGMMFVPDIGLNMHNSNMALILSWGLNGGLSSSFRIAW